MADPVVPYREDDEMPSPSVLSQVGRRFKSVLKVRQIKAVGRGKKTHYETLHGADAVQALRAQHDAAFQTLLAHLTGPVKAKVIGSIARQAAKQLKARVPASQMQFVLEPHLENLVEQELTQIFNQSSLQAQREVTK